MRLRFLASAVAPLVVLGAAAAWTQPLSPRELPPALRPWVPWVLDEVPDLGCPRVQGSPICIWPGRLSLDLGAKGGSFRLDLQADRPAVVRLPGSGEIWPQAVRQDGRPAPAFEGGGGPNLRVTAGHHRVAGRFTWQRLPESLSVPAAIGIVDLRLDGQAVPRPRREADGLLWLGARRQTSDDGDSLRLQVFRRILDGVSLFVETRLQFEVAGRAREVRLPGALLPASVTVGAEGELPVRVEARTVRVQLRAGRYAVVVHSRVEGRPEAIERPRSVARDWPEREVWVFAADERLRQVELSGPPPIDPSRTELPSQWRSLPAFVVEPGARLALSEVRRGQPAPLPDSLTLSRELWLDPNGASFSVRDRFGGTLRGTTRLDLAPPGRLGRAVVDGQDQLVTTNPETKAEGIELRRAALRLEADSRLPAGGRQSAVGWDTGVEQLNAVLHLPPGWSLLFASGVDQLPGTWAGRWTLLAFFFVLIVALAVHRLLGPRHALLAFAALVLTHGEAGAPRLVWLSLLGAIALRRVAPDGRRAGFARAWFLASVAVLVVVAVPFARDQVRDALFPQVAEADMTRVVMTGAAGGVVGSPPAVPEERQEEPSRLKSLGHAADRAMREGKAASVVSQEANRYALNQALERDPKAVLQTGPGLPSWSWRGYSLGWTGPVGRDHSIRLLLASPAVNRALTFLRLSLLGLLGYVLLAGRWPRLARPPAGPRAAAALAAVVLIAPAAGAQEAATASPGREVLEEMRRRLTRPMPCEPACVSTPEVVLRMLDSRLQVRAEVHAAADGAWAVPGPLAAWAPSELMLDGRRAVAVAHLEDGFLHLRLGPGVHQVEATGPLPAGDSFTLQFGDTPRHARAEAPGWNVSGLRADGPAEPSILLTRRLTTRNASASAAGLYAPWLEISRTVGLGVTWTVQTRVRRLTPLGAPIAVRVPLLPGEAPTRANLVVERGEAAVSLAGDETETAWESTLAQISRLTLRAPQDRPWSEVWKLSCSPIWSCKAAGLSPVSRVEDGVFISEFRPWPSETLDVTPSHPEGAEGQTLTVDGATVEASPGDRLERVRLLVSVRSSREQPFVLRLPGEADLQAVSVDGQERPSLPDKGDLRLMAPAGTHTIDLRWQSGRGVGLVYSAPRVELAVPAVNARVQVTLPPDRWLLTAHGPTWGPAVLFWPYLLFLLAVSFGLGRLPQSPLTGRQWTLLGLGLSQLPAAGALVVAGFVFAIELRRRRPPRRAATFDLVQIGLVLWAAVSLVLLYLAIRQGLLFRPDMQVAGNGSSDAVLRWYADRVAGALPSPSVVSLPLWVYRIGMLLWSLWLAAGLVRGIGWSWRAFGESGWWRTVSLWPTPKGVSGPAKA